MTQRKEASQKWKKGSQHASKEANVEAYIGALEPALNEAISEITVIPKITNKSLSCWKNLTNGTCGRD